MEEIYVTDIRNVIYICAYVHKHMSTNMLAPRPKKTGQREFGMGLKLKKLTLFTV